MNKYSSAAIISLSLVSGSSIAALAPETGFSGEVNLLAGYYRDTNNFSTNHSAYQQDITSKAESSDEANNEVDGDGIAGLLGNVDYTFGSKLNHQLFLGTSREEIATGSLAFELGYRYQFKDGTTVAFSTLPTLVSTEVWADPYAINENRKKTDLSGNAGRIKVDHLMGSAFGVDFGFGVAEVDEDNSGEDAQTEIIATDGEVLTAEEAELLQRDRKYASMKVDYLYFLPNKMGAVRPSFTYAKSDADGEALSYDSYKAEISYAKVIGHHSYAVTLDARKRDYDAVNPLYDVTREDKQYGLFFAYEYAEIFGAKDWGLVTLMGANKIDSNINYYDSDFLFVSVGANYKF
ncbi:DUF2860 family protein [Vibrio maerlii]|uniref:DUF2860 family protein n=1 Tax=Vibrio maerlii TaxID=2231648 RepID=UPI000E3BE37C|nr:DUF2860 family protein [Vibrio maerlii]